MTQRFLRFIYLLVAFPLVFGCSSFQPTKNVWKGTKDLWATYVSPPASVDYEEKGDLPPEALALSTAMMGIDVELGKLERVMSNADRPPTMEWLRRLFETFPWITGFAGVKYDGTILGQEPPDSMKSLDFNYLLYEDKLQKSRALRTDVQPSPLGPEIMLATPLYDGVDFLGIVVAYFDMRQLMGFSRHPEDLVVLCPTALLWPGKYNFASTPLAGVDWAKVVKESSAGVCTNANGSFVYMVRYLGNLPMVFAVPEKGNFQEGSGDISQGFAFFPKEREKMAPPPVPEGRKQKEASAIAAFGKSEDEELLSSEPGEPVLPEDTAPAPAQASAPARPESGVIQPGSRESVLLRGKQKAQGRQIEERELEGENVPVERVQRQRRPRAPEPEAPPQPALGLLPDEEGPTLTGGRPSPFGPREEAQPVRPSPFGPRPAQESAVMPSQREATPVPETTPPSPAQPQESATPDSGNPGVSAPAEQPEAPPMLPGGRPSPFGPR